MKICIKENEFNPSLLYQKWCSEEMAIEMGYTIVEVDEKYADCCFDDFNEDLTFSVDKYSARKQKEYAIPRIAELNALLKDYDYIGTKIATGRGTREEYAKEIEQMTEWANEINELERYIYEVKNAINQE